MKQRRRIYYTEVQKALMWERWQKGESLQHIAQLFDRNHSSVQGILAETGGIRPDNDTARAPRIDDGRRCEPVSPCPQARSTWLANTSKFAAAMAPVH